MKQWAIIIHIGSRKSCHNPCVASDQTTPIDVVSSVLNEYMMYGWMMQNFRHNSFPKVLIFTYACHAPI